MCVCLYICVYIYIYVYIHLYSHSARWERDLYHCLSGTDTPQEEFIMATKSLVAPIPGSVFQGPGSRKRTAKGEEFVPEGNA